MKTQISPSEGEFSGSEGEFSRY